MPPILYTIPSFFPWSYSVVKSELIQKLSDKLPDMQARDVELALNCIIEYMAKSLESGERIEIRGFGSFSVRTRPARNARNPKTGESVKLPAKAVVHFKPGLELRDRVNDSSGKYEIKA